MKNSQIGLSLKEEQIKELKQYILQMEQEPSVYDQLNEDQTFGIVVIILTKSSYHRTQYEIEILKKATKHIVYFQKLLEKDQGVLLWERCLRKMSYNYLKKGETLFREGDVGTTFYIILQGKVSIHKRLLIGDSFQDKELTQIGDGFAFGELALENNEPRSATITAIIPTHLAVLDKEDYLVIKRTVKNQQRQMYFEEFAKLTIFRDWKFMSIKSLFDVIKMNKYGLNHTVYKEGDPSNEIYFIQTGEFKVIKSLKMNRENLKQNNQNIDDDLEFLKQQFAYNQPPLTNQEKIDKLYQKKKYGNLVASDKILQMTLKFLGAGEMFGELEILKAPDLCRQFSLVSTFETNNVYSVQKRDFMRVLYCDPPLNRSLISLNDKKLKQILQQIRVYEKNFIDQSEKINILERTQNKTYLNPDIVVQIKQEQNQIKKFGNSSLTKVSSRIQLSDNKLREMTLTLDNPEAESGFLSKLQKSAQSVKHSRQKTEELIIQQYLKNKNKNKRQTRKHKSPQGILGSAFEHISYHIRRNPTQTSSTQRQKTTTSCKIDLDRSSKSQFFFNTCLPLVLQNNYYRLKTKQSV